MKSKLVHISIKMIIVGVIALFIAKFLGVTNYTTASAIGILSVQWSKRDFLSIATKRVISGVLAIIVSAIAFYVFPANFLVYVIFMSFFILLSWLFNAPEGIVPSMVIVAHIFLIDTITLKFVYEEVLLLIIAVVVAFIVNMLYPQYTLREMKLSLVKVDSIIEDELLSIIDKLKDIDRKDSLDSKQEIDKLMNEAKMIDRDLIVQNDHRYITYLYMRNSQLYILNNITNNINNIKDNHPYKLKVANFFSILKDSIGFNDRATPLLIELDDLFNYFINESLPKTRSEFETRATLFTILNETRSFLNLKIEFHETYPNFLEEGSDKNEYKKFI